jgi:hypothetical protein
MQRDEGMQAERLDVNAMLMSSRSLSIALQFGRPMPRSDKL